MLKQVPLICTDQLAASARAELVVTTAGHAQLAYSCKLAQLPTGHARQDLVNGTCSSRVVTLQGEPTGRMLVSDHCYPAILAEVRGLQP